MCILTIRGLLVVWYTIWQASAPVMGARASMNMPKIIQSLLSGPCVEGSNAMDIPALCMKSVPIITWSGGQSACVLLCI